MSREALIAVNDSLEILNRLSFLKLSLVREIGFSRFLTIIKTKVKIDI